MCVTPSVYVCIHMALRVIMRISLDVYVMMRMCVLCECVCLMCICWMCVCVMHVSCVFIDVCELVCA